MPFNSIIFILFFLVFFTGWQIVKKTQQPKWIYITFMSFLFYGWWDWRFIFLIIFSGMVDYVCGLKMASSPKLRKTYLLISLIANMGALGFFKYTYFLINTINQLFEFMGSSLVVSEPNFTIILPVGISFYTFQSLSYTIDIYRGKLQPTKNIFHFFSYLAMFPQLVAGPIIRAKDLLTQLKQVRIPSQVTIYHGWKLIAYGLFQKVVIADNLGYMVDRVYGFKTVHEGSPMWWVAAIAFSFQIYYDFSGYSLIARGLAKLMGLHFKMNFNHPYVSTGFREFWSRWHISLSSWFRDYVYIPMGGNKKGFTLALIFMAFTMIISGIWHGANLTFVIWGLLHAIFLTGERLVVNLKVKFPSILKWLTTYFLVLIAWVFFRAETTDEALNALGIMFSLEIKWTFINEFFDAELFLFLAILMEIYWLMKTRSIKFRRLTETRVLEVLKIPVAFACSIFLRGPEAAFIYFQF